MCLRKIHGLNKVKLIDAVWIWTEPHSMRLKIKLTIQKEVMTGAIVQQATVVEFTIRNQQCKHCEASFAQGAWHAIVQLRQRVPHKRTFFYLEQLILKHEAHTECIKIVTFRDGMDFYYKDKNQALRFIEFLNNHVPTKMKYSRKLVSADHTNNVGDFKHNYLVEIAPICKDDLVLLPRELASKQSNISPLVVVKRVAAGLHVIDPLTGERSEISAEKYWRYSFSSLFTSKSLTRYVVLSVEPVLLEQRPSARMKRSHSQFASRAISKLAECVIARERDLGNDDTQFTIVTHLGPLLAAGDIVLGYDLASANMNVDAETEATLEKLPIALPDVILIRKSYEHKDRAYTLRNLDSVVPVEKPQQEATGENDQQYEADMEDFLQQVDADKEFRSQINLYKKSQQQASHSQQQGKKSKKDSQKRSRLENDNARRGKMDLENDDEADHDGEYDDEEVRLEELLEEMALSEDLLGEGEEQGKRILSSAEAAQVKAFDLNMAGASGFGGLQNDDEDDEDL